MFCNKMRSTIGTVLHASTRSQTSRPITTSSLMLSLKNRKCSTTDSNNHATSDGDSSLNTTNAQPKVYSSDITGSGLDAADQLTDEQKKEVAEHNRYFTNQSSPRKKEQVDDKFWKSNPKA